MATALRQFMGRKSTDELFLVDIVIGSVPGTGTWPTIYSAALLARIDNVLKNCLMYIYFVVLFDCLGFTV